MSASISNNQPRSTFLHEAARCAETVASTIAVTLAIIVGAVAHPIIGPLGSLGCLLGAAYHMDWL